MARKHRIKQLIPLPLRLKHDLPPIARLGGAVKRRSRFHPGPRAVLTRRLQTKSQENALLRLPQSAHLRGISCLARGWSTAHACRRRGERLATLNRRVARAMARGRAHA